MDEIFFNFLVVYFFVIIGVEAYVNKTTNSFIRKYNFKIDKKSKSLHLQIKDLSQMYDQTDSEILIKKIDYIIKINKIKSRVASFIFIIFFGVIFLSYILEYLRNS